MHAVGANEQVGVMLLVCAGFAVAKHGAHTFAILLECLEAHAAANRLLTEARVHGGEQEELQPSAMDGILRPPVTGSNAALFAVDELTEFIEVTQRLRG